MPSSDKHAGFVQASLAFIHEALPSFSQPLTEVTCDERGDNTHICFFGVEKHVCQEVVHNRLRGVYAFGNVYLTHVTRKNDGWMDALSRDRCGRIQPTQR